MSVGVVDLALHNDWNWLALHDILLPQVLDHIRGVVPPSPTPGLDTCYWSQISTRAFSIKSAYNMLAKSTTKPH
ncbi:hypothetical protein V6N13_129772 [Hibiscus sabdariffa]